MKTKLVSLSIAVGLFWGCQTTAITVKAMTLPDPQNVKVSIDHDGCKSNIDFGPNPGDGIDVNFGPVPGSRKDSRQRSYA